MLSLFCLTAAWFSKNTAYLFTGWGFFNAIYRQALAIVAISAPMAYLDNLKLFVIPYFAFILLGIAIMGYLQTSKTARDWIFPIVVAGALSDSLYLLIVHCLEMTNTDQSASNLSLLDFGEVWMFVVFFFLSWWLVGIFWEDRFCRAEERDLKGDARVT